MPSFRAAATAARSCRFPTWPRFKPAKSTEQRPVQSDLFHGRQPGAVSADFGERGLARDKILEQLRFLHRGFLRSCRFGMYEAEYRFALKNAGFDGFRVLLFNDSDGMKAASGEPGLKFTVDFGLGMLNAMHLGDVMNDLIYQIRPFEVNKGETENVFRRDGRWLSDHLRDRPAFEIVQRAPN